MDEPSTVNLISNLTWVHEFQIKEKIKKADLTNGLLLVSLIVLGLSLEG